MTKEFKIKIEIDLWVVCSINPLTNAIMTYPKLFDIKEEAQALADEVGGSVHSVFYIN